MGKGDIRTKRGKIFRGTYGNRRPKGKKRRPQATEAPPKTGKGEQT
ncbi:MAG TPA: 30S ribosomal protein THX [Gemmatimonadales bacterium]|nr:30S ribosomal protein THX [Gemmatimonadales bacterium]